MAVGNGKRVVVAMSGGVDSSVAAALLKRQGYDVIGVTMQLWPDAPAEIMEREGGCCSLSAVSDARRVADVLDIPYYVLNFQETFQRAVIDRFTAEYAAGRTPNPCVDCNKYVKFEPLLHKARELAADYLATGHYARIVWDPAAGGTGPDGAPLGRWQLRKAADPRKDQTYALYGLKQEQLARVLFPLGGMTKDRVRELAAEFGLPTAKKAESQEICFVVDGSYRDFLQQQIPEAFRPGPIVDTRGNVLGEHRGLPNYTVGQRQGLGLAAGYPLYVLRLEPETNTLVVGRAEEVFAPALIATDANWVSWPPPAAGAEWHDVMAKIRYNAREVAAQLRLRDDGRVEVRFAEPQRAITPGQAVVFYRDDAVWGGATIEQVLSVPGTVAGAAGLRQLPVVP